MGRLLASKKNSELFGQTEFQVRDAVHRMGAAALEAHVADFEEVVAGRLELVRDYRIGEEKVVAGGENRAASALERDDRAATVDLRQPAKR